MREADDCTSSRGGVGSGWRRRPLIEKRRRGGPRRVSAAAQIRPSQQRADGGTSAPRQLLPRSRSLTLRSCSVVPSGRRRVFPQTTGSQWNQHSCQMRDITGRRGRRCVATGRVRPAERAGVRDRRAGGPMWRPARRTFALANRVRRSPANRPAAPVPPRPWGSRRAGALSVGRLPGCLVSDHVATTQAPVGAAGAATHPPRLPRPAASAAPGASAARGRAAPAALRRRGSPRAGRAARAGGCCR